MERNLQLNQAQGWGTSASTGAGLKQRESELLCCVFRWDNSLQSCDRPSSTTHPEFTVCTVHVKSVEWAFTELRLDSDTVLSAAPVAGCCGNEKLPCAHDNLCWHFKRQKQGELQWERFKQACVEPEVVPMPANPSGQLTKAPTILKMSWVTDVRWLTIREWDWMWYVCHMFPSCCSVS